MGHRAQRGCAASGALPSRHLLHLAVRRPHVPGCSAVLHRRHPVPGRLLEGDAGVMFYKLSADICKLACAMNKCIKWRRCSGWAMSPAAPFTEGSFGLLMELLPGMECQVVSCSRLQGLHGGGHEHSTPNSVAIQSAGTRAEAQRFLKTA